MIGMRQFGRTTASSILSHWTSEVTTRALLQDFWTETGCRPPGRVEMAEEMESGLKAYGHVVMRVRIDPVTFADLVRGPWHDFRL